MLVVWKLDRLGRNLAHLVNTVQDLSARGVGLRVLAGQGAQIDTTTAAGRLVFGIFAALAEFERELIRERTVAGLKAARARGRKGGRKFALTKPQVRLALPPRTTSPPASATTGRGSTAARAARWFLLDEPPVAGVLHSQSPAQAFTSRRRSSPGADAGCWRSMLAAVAARSPTGAVSGRGGQRQSADVISKWLRYSLLRVW